MWENDPIWLFCAYFSNGLKLNHQLDIYLGHQKKTLLPIRCRGTNGAQRSDFPRGFDHHIFSPNKIWIDIKTLTWTKHRFVTPPNWWFLAFIGNLPPQQKNRFEKKSTKKCYDKTYIEDGLRARSGQTWLALLWWLRTRTGAARFGPDRESATRTGAAGFGPDRESAVVYLGGFSGLWGLRDTPRTYHWPFPLGETTSIKIMVDPISMIKTLR